MESHKGFFFWLTWLIAIGGGDATYKSGMTFKAPQLEVGEVPTRDHGKLRYRQGAPGSLIKGMIFLTIHGGFP